MRWPFLVAFAVALVVDMSQELICNPDDATDCYPKVFEPRDEWQPIREGQEIPGGLHVRVNLETGVREARIMDESYADGETDGGVVVVETEQDEEALQQEHLAQLAQEHQEQQLEKEEIARKVAEFKNKRVRASPEEITDFDSALAALYTYEEDAGAVEVALDVLEELSHDIEFGVRLTADKLTFDVLEAIVESGTDSVREKAYRVMAASLRNNPDAVTNVLSNQSSGFVSLLFAQLHADTTSHVIKKRILGVVQALAADEHFRYNYFNVGQASTGGGFEHLVDVFPQLDDSARVRVINIFEDLRLIDTIDTGKGDKWSIEHTALAENKMSVLLQQHLARNKLHSEHQFKVFFNHLVELHKTHKHLRPSSEFLNWLAAEITGRQSGNRPRDRLYSGSDAAFDKTMLRARHEVFGNPLARKMDEL